MTTEKEQADAWGRELATLTEITRARQPDVDPLIVQQEATGILLLATLPDAQLVDALAQLRLDIVRRGIASYVSLRVDLVGDFEIADDDKPIPHRGIVATGTADDVRRCGPAVNGRVLVEIPRRTS